MTRVIRIDAGSVLRASETTPQGFLRVDGYAGKVGIYPYYDAKTGKVRKEFRPPAEVFKKSALDGFEGAPLTDGHPLRPVDTTNVKHVEVGTVTSSARRDGDHVAVATVIKDPATIAKVKAGKQQLSPGYALDLEMTPGYDPQYGHYDAVQKNIEINHLAIVDEARGGPTVRFRMDGVDMATIVHHDAELDATERDNLAAKSFAAKGGKLPIQDAEHVRAAMSRFSQTEFMDDDDKAAAYGKIVAAAKKFEIDATGFIKKYGPKNEDWLSTWGGPDVSSGPQQLTSIVDGHQHTLSVTAGCSDTSYALRDGDDTSHSHTWYRVSDGSIELTENAGHTHTILPDPVQNNDSSSGGAAPAATQGAPQMAEQKPTTINNDEALTVLRAQLINAEKSLVTVTAERDAEKFRADSLQGELKTVSAQIPVLKAELASVQTARETVEIKKQQERADSAERQVTALEASIKPRVRERVALMVKAQTHLGEAFRMDDLSDRQIMVSVIRHLDKAADIADSIPEGEIVGQFKQLTRMREDSARSLARVSETLAAQTHTDARQTASDTRRDAWKKPLPNDLRSTK